MIVEDVFKNGKWLKCVGTSPQHTTKAGAYFAEMQRRCTAALQVGKYERYKGCEHHFEGFQDFANWARGQIGYGWNLDKDLLIKGNKIYSKNTCVFLPTELNNLLTKCDKRRGLYPLGVSFDAKRGYKASLSLGKNHKKYLGYFTTAHGAFTAYKTAKECWIKQQAIKWKDQIDPRACEALMNYQVEITD